MRRTVSRIVLSVLACVAVANASATLLLEEPYGKLGFWSAAGHAAVYLSNVCAETPLVLRPCAPGETGVVISRYDGIGKYDWIAVPLIPYLYAVEHPEDIPLFADAKTTAFLRDRYRRQYLEEVAPDLNNGGAPGGNWYELVGSSYDRTIYGYEIETSPEQDAALIRQLNSSPNESHFHAVSQNCADFAKDIVNFYYPKALQRSVVADIGITTPKQIAKRLIRYSAHHPELPFSRFVIAQVPGSLPRSAAVRGVVDSFFRSKMYIVPSAVVSPIFAGCVGAVYFGTGAERFSPARDATVFALAGAPEDPLNKRDLRNYRRNLKQLLAESYPDQRRNADKAWERLQSRAKVSVDEQGRPVIEVRLGQRRVDVGIAADNLPNSSAPPELVRQLVEARLESELLHRPAQGLSRSEIARDWDWLHETALGRSAPVAAISARRGYSLRASQP
jgi:hypothetical protein